MHHAQCSTDAVESGRLSTDLVVDRVGGLPVGHPADDAGVALLAHERQGALVGSEAGVVVGVGSLRVGRPVAQPPHAAGGQLAGASAAHARVDLNTLE